MLPEDLHALSVDSDALESSDDIGTELSFLAHALADQPIDAAALADAGLLHEALSETRRARYQVSGPSFAPTMARVAAASLVTFPAALQAVPAFANEPLPQNFMIAMSQRPLETPALGAQGAAPLFPFSRPMLALKAQVAEVPQPVAVKSVLPLNPRLKAIFSAQPKVAVTTKHKSACTFYQVGKGDSLYSIAADILGSGSRWREVYAANKGKIAAGYVLHPGTRLVIPTNRHVPDVKTVLLADKAPANSPAAPGARYHVAPGDSLYTIAARKLHNPRRWKEIAALNRATLGRKTVIYPNQWLTLPALT